MSSLWVGSFLTLSEDYGVAFVSSAAAWLHFQHSLNPFEVWLFVALGSVFAVLMVAIQSQNMTNGINRALNFIVSPPSDVSTSRWLLIITVAGVSDFQWLLVFQSSILSSPAECWSVLHSCDLLITPLLLRYLFNLKLGYLSFAGMTLILAGLVLCSISIKDELSVMYGLLASLLQVFRRVGHRLIKPSHDDEERHERARNAAEAYRHSNITKSVLIYIQFIVGSLVISLVCIIYFAGISPDSWHNPFQLLASNQQAFFALCGVAAISVSCVLLKTMNVSTVGHHLYSVLELLVIPLCLLCQWQFDTRQPGNALFFTGSSLLIFGGALRSRDAWKSEGQYIRRQDDYKEEHYQHEKLEEEESESDYSSLMNDPL